MASYFSAPGGELWVKDLLSFEHKNIEIVEAKIDWRLREGVDFFVCILVLWVAKGKVEIASTPKSLGVAQARQRHEHPSVLEVWWHAGIVCATARRQLRFFP